jgi:hypothetical protein
LWHIKNSSETKKHNPSILKKLTALKTEKEKNIQIAMNLLNS